jgi:predicted transcriptional regulator of viral defense system
MNYRLFKNKLNKFPIINSSLLRSISDNNQVMKNQVSRWSKQGLLIKLRRGLYVLNESDRSIEPSRLFLANELYPPAYISLEYALAYYDLIPEKVVDITAITPRKTMVFKNSFGIFRYHHLKTSVFRGFVTLRDAHGRSFFMATPEKAIIDFMYLNLPRFQRKDTHIFGESYRFQNTRQLRRPMIKKYAAAFNNNKLIAVVTMFLAYIKTYA